MKLAEIGNKAKWSAIAVTLDFLAEGIG